MTTPSEPFREQARIAVIFDVPCIDMANRALEEDEEMRIVYDMALN